MSRSRFLTALFALFILAAVAQPAAAHYDPKLGRWLERDPLGTRPELVPATLRIGQMYPDGMNLYENVQSSPLIMLDPLGLDGEPKPPNPKQLQGRKGAQALKRFAIKSGCTIEKGAEHLRVLKGGKLITTIPHSIHGTGTARNIIKSIRTARGCARVGGLVGIAAGEVVFLTVEWGYWEYQAKKGEDATNEWNQMIAEIMAHGRQQGANARAGLCMTCCGEPFAAEHCDHAFDSAIAMGFKMLAIANSTSACSTFDQITQRAFQEFVECTEKACEDTGCDPCDGSG